MNRGLSLERLLKWGLLLLFLQRGRLISHRFALAVHFKWTVERQDVYLCCIINYVLFSDLASVVVLHHL